MVALWSLILASSRQHFDVLISNVVVYIIALYIFKLSEMPGMLVINKDCICRIENPNYAVFHSLWHVASLSGPLMSTWYFITYCNDRSNHIMGVHESVSIDGYGFFPIVPSVALLLSVGINILGNATGIMPPN